MGSQAFAQMQQKQPTTDDPALTGYVQCLAENVIDANQDRLETKNWDVKVFASDQVNAFALPGGHIGMYRGMVEFAENAPQLAAVMAHEVAHVYADHSNARVSQQLMAQGVLGAVSALSEMEGTTRKLVLGALGVGYQVGVQLPHSRDQEAEADALGLDMMARAGFDPRGAVELWRRMSQRGGERPPEMLSTHPHPESRVEALRERMQDVLPVYRKAREAGRVPRCEAPPVAALPSRGR
jgi:predicted Zn-dependent protease